MRKRLFSAGRTWSGAKSSMASVILRTMASMGCLQLGFEDLLARLEPLAIVVAGEVAEEGEGFGAEVRLRCGGCGFWLGGHCREKCIAGSYRITFSAPRKSASKSAASDLSLAMAFSMAFSAAGR